MKNLFGVVGVLLLLTTACGTSVADVDLSVAAPTPAGVIDAVLVTDGRDAIADAKGTPHILWFWGAH